MISLTLCKVLRTQCNLDTLHQRHSIYLKIEEGSHYFKLMNRRDVTQMKECGKITMTGIEVQQRGAKEGVGRRKRSGDQEEIETKYFLYKWWQMWVIFP
jgi:hypothetical protein